MADQIQQILVIGAGVMGRGIALTMARAGLAVKLYDLQPEMLTQAQQYSESFLSKSVEKGKMTSMERQASLDRLHFIDQDDQWQADLVIEAVPERLDLKHLVLQKAAAQNGPHTILASNTSTLPITRIASAIEYPERVVGMHFFNPAPLMKLVEVIAGAATSPEVVDATYQLAEALGKQPVKAKDVPGFIVNRVARHFYLESLRSLENGNVSPEILDRLMRSMGFRMGPFELMDLIGVETNHSVTCSMFESFFYDEKFRPSRIQQQKVDAGHFGRKSGQGFYPYSK